MGETLTRQYRAEIAGILDSGLTRDDLEHCAATARDLAAGLESCEYCHPNTSGPCESDCHASETIVVSRGYVDVYPDGDVVARGRVIATVSP